MAAGDLEIEQQREEELGPGPAANRGHDRGIPNIEVPTQRRQRSAGCSRERERLLLEGDDDRRTIDKKVAGRGLI
jgi:hypothetical protein